MTKKQHRRLNSILNKMWDGRRNPNGKFDLRVGSSMRLTRAECDELIAMVDAELEWNEVDRDDSADGEGKWGFDPAVQP